MKTHVYKLVLGLFFTLFAFNLNAQDYEYIPMVKPGVQIWTDDFTDAANRYYFRRFALTDEDTVIDNQTYKKLYFFTNPSFNPLTDTCIGGLREDEQRRVYYKGKSLNGCVYSRLICDFSLSIGDTYNLYYQIDFVVHSIDTLEISGIKRRAFSLKPSFDTLSENPHIACVWIEGIGNKNGLLYDVINNITHNEAGGWDRCYEHNGVLLYHNYLYGIEDCITPLYGLDEIKLEDNSITLYPNPTSMDVNISSESIINSIEVFNSLGQKVYQTNVKQKEKTLDINSLSKGVYIIGVSTDMGYIRKKLIKE